MSALALETCRAAFELRKPDAKRRVIDAIVRARQAGNAELEQALADILIVNRHRRLSDDGGPTPEQLVIRRHRQRGDTIETLLRNRRLNYRQEAAALQIERVCQGVTGPLWARGARYEQGHIDGGGTVGLPEQIAQLYALRYLPWARWMRAPASVFQICHGCGRPYTIPVSTCGGCGRRRFWRSKPHLPLVLTIAVYGGGIEACAIAYRMRRHRALRLLRLGLDRYADFSEGVC